MNLDDQFNRNIQQREQLMQQQQQNFDQREKALEPLRQQQIKMAQQPIPQPPQPQQLPAAPKRNDPGADEAWLSVAMVLGAIGGGLTRRHTTNALAAMTGAIEGYNEGSRQKFDQNVKIWDAETKKILETNKAANDQYKQILESKTLAIQQKAMELQLTAAKFEDRAAMQLAQMGHLEKLGDLIEKRSQFEAQLAQHEAQLRQQHAHWLAQERAADQRNERLAQSLQYRYDPAMNAARTIANAEPKALAADLTKLTQQRSAITQYEQTALKNMDYLIQLADKVDRSGIPVLERWLRGGEKAMGDNDVRAFVAQLEVVKPEIARILSNPNLTGALTNYARQEIEAFMDPGMSAKNVRTVVELLKRDFQNRARSLDDEINSVRSQLRNLTPGQGPAPLPQPTAPVQSSAPAQSRDLGGGWTVQMSQ